MVSNSAEWKLVPVRATDEMVSKVIPMYDAMIAESEWPFTKNLYEALVAAAPIKELDTRLIHVDVIHTKLNHARKRRQDDVKLWPDQDMWWAGYMTALAQLIDLVDAQRLVAGEEIAPGLQNYGYPHTPHDI